MTAKEANHNSQKTERISFVPQASDPDEVLANWMLYWANTKALFKYGRFTIGELNELTVVKVRLEHDRPAGIAHLGNGRIKTEYVFGSVREVYAYVAQRIRNIILPGNSTVVATFESSTDHQKNIAIIMRGLVGKS